MMENSYKVILNPPSKHKIYYVRIKQVDYNGEYEYFNWLTGPFLPEEEEEPIYDILGRQLR